MVLLATTLEIVQGLQTFHIGFIADADNVELEQVFTEKITQLNNKTKEFQLVPVVTNQNSTHFSSLDVQEQICSLVNKINMTVVVGPLNRKHVADTSNMLSILGIPNIVPIRLGRFKGNLWSSYQINLGMNPSKAPFVELLKLYDWNKVTVVYSNDDYGMSEMIGIVEAVSDDNSVTVVEEISVPVNNDNEQDWVDVGLR